MMMKKKKEERRGRDHFRHLAFPRMALIACAPTVPCLHHERYLLRKDRQGIPSCKIDTHTT